MDNNTNWQNEVLEENLETLDNEQYEEELKEKSWFEGIKEQIEKRGQACLAY